MIFYYALNSVSVAAHIALYEAGLAFESRRIDFSKSEQRGPDYLNINTKGRVPALETEQGIITETPAILVYIAQLAPAAGLAPLDDPFEFARMQAFNMYLCATVHVAHAHKHRGSRWADDPAAIEAMKQKVSSNMRDCFTLIEREMFVGPWVLGRQYSVADIYLYTVSRWLPGDGVDLAEFPVIAEHHRRMSQKAAVQKVLEIYEAAS